MSEDYSPEFLNEMRERLEEKRAELINKGKIARDDLREREASPGDSIDESTDEQGTSTNMHLKDRERNFLAQVNEALQRVIEDGEYGYCDNCGDTIGEARLRARPMATLCIECKEEVEEEERQSRSKNPGMFSPSNRM